MSRRWIYELCRRGFVTPQPQKRPKSSFVRFEAAMPNGRWQADITHWKLSGGAEVEMLNVIDDHSRFLVASDALREFKAADIVASFHKAASTCGFPASLLTDNGAVAHGYPGTRPGRRPAGAGADRGRGVAPRADAGPQSGLPATWALVRWNDVQRHVGTMSRDITLVPPGRTERKGRHSVGAFVQVEATYSLA